MQLEQIMSSGESKPFAVFKGDLCGVTKHAVVRLLKDLFYKDGNAQ